MEQPSVREASERIDALLDELGQSAVAGGHGAGRGARAARDEPVRRRARPDRRDRSTTTPCAASPTTRWSATCWCCTTCTPTTCDTRVQRGARAGAALPRLARGRRLAVRRRRARRRAPAARGQLRRLPVLGAHREERDRGRDPGGRARRGRRRGRGHGRARAGAAPDRAVPAARAPETARRARGSTWTSTCRRAPCAAVQVGRRDARRGQPRRHPGRLPRPLSGLPQPRSPRGGSTATS